MSDKTNDTRQKAGDMPKYRIRVTDDEQAGMPAGLHRVLDMLQQNIEPRQSEHQQPPQQSELAPQIRIHKQHR